MQSNRLTMWVLCTAAVAAFAVPGAGAADIVRPIDDIARLSTAAHTVARDAVRRDFADGRDAGLLHDESIFERYRVEDVIRERADECLRGALHSAAFDLLSATARKQPFDFRDTLWSSLDGCLSRTFPGYERWAGAMSAAMANNWTGAALVAARSYPTVNMFYAWLQASASAVP